MRVADVRDVAPPARVAGQGALTPGQKAVSVLPSPQGAPK